MELETFKKLPLGGVDRRALVGLLESKGPDAAKRVLAEQRAQLAPAGVSIPDDAAVLILGGSNGITRAVAVQLLFGERVPVYGVHYDSAKMQIGVHHVAAIEEAAKEEGVACAYFNRDATRDKTIDEVVAHLKGRYRVVHLINGIAAGATKRYEQHGPAKVRDLDVAFDPVLQVPDFANPEAYRTLGLVEVEVATEAEIERTNKFMGSSSLLWTEPLAEAGLIVAGESVVAFCDYDFEKDDPVYAMGPLAGAKILQRETMAEIERRFGARTVRLCYPAMGTTALGAIPGGMLMFALTAQILLERRAYRTLADLARGTMAIWREPTSELRLDEAYQQCLPEFHARKDSLTPADLPNAFSALFGQSL
jgi:enoyl-[acyl-carrier protein] reductase / trans-2-enoyl-CoA reductase (NAD+)